MKLRKTLVQFLESNTSNNAEEFKLFLFDFQQIKKSALESGCSLKAFNIELLAAKRQLGIHPWRWR